MKLFYTWIHEYVTQFHVQFTIDEIGSHTFELFFEQRVAETEGRAGKLGKNGGVACRIVAFFYE